MLNKKTILRKENILYFDEDIVVVNKPSNIQTVPGYQDKYSLASIIQKMFSVPNIENMSPHRLDLQTSGVVVFARNMNALRDISQQFREKSIMKRYSAIVHGSIQELNGEINLPIGKDTLAGPPLFTIDHSKDGRNAQTTWTVVESTQYCTKLHLFPKTGRTHQLRLHMAAIGHPILGDFFYSPPSVFRSSDRLLLHAEELVMRLPSNKKEIQFIANCPFSLVDYNRRISIGHEED